jgi:competence protein ComEA
MAPPPDAPPERKLWLDWSDRDQRVLIVLAALVFVGVGVHWMQWRMRGESLVEIERLPARQYDFKVDINRATWVEWMQLPGIGEILARRIVADRTQNGPFESVDGLNRVSGVGTATLDTIRPWLVCSDCKINTIH